MHKCCLEYIADTDVKEILREGESMSHFYGEDLSFLSVHNGVVLPSGDWTDDGCLPGGICDEDGKFIDQSGCREGGSIPYVYEEYDVEDVCEEVVFMGFFLNCYGHGITDHIKKLWFLQSNDYKILKKRNPRLKIIYIVENNQPLPSWQYEIFSLAGYDASDWCQVTKLTRFDNIIIPCNSLINTNEFRQYTKEFCGTINRIKANVPLLQKPIEKLYFTRTGIRNLYRECGESRIEKVFKQKGYCIVRPEEISVKEQIAMMISCKSFASTEGSCAHNSIFCAPGTEVIILRKADYANSFQMMINDFAKLDVTYIDIHHSDRVDLKQPWHGPFYLYVSPFLRRKFHLLYSCPYWLDPLYWVYRRNKWNLYFRVRPLFRR